MKSNIISGLKLAAGRTVLLLRLYSPEILMVTGIVGTVASTVLACKATLKADSVIKATQSAIDEARELRYTAEDKQEYTKNLAMQYGIRAGLLIRLYGPSVLLGALSISMIVGSNRILTKRNIAVMAAYKLIDERFKDYRSNVIEEYGEEKDRQFSKLTQQDPPENGVLSEGRPTDIKKLKFPRTRSIYARTFQEDNPNWARNRDYNILFLTSVQNWANDLLRGRGHVFLNEVYDYLGLTRTQEGQAVGWVYDKKKRVGDNYIDFGLLDPENQIDVRLQEEEVNHNPPIELDFNVDGVIWDSI